MPYLVHVAYFLHNKNYVCHPSTRRNHMEVGYLVKQFYILIYYETCCDSMLSDCN